MGWLLDKLFAHKEATRRNEIIELQRQEIMVRLQNGTSQPQTPAERRVFLASVARAEELRNRWMVLLSTYTE